MADEDNLQGAVWLITQHTPPALINDSMMPHIMELYPQSGEGGICPDISHEAKDNKGSLYLYSDDVLLPIFKQLKQQTHIPI
eukprot:14022253-Ditylum_brightwellii.AAC.1